jgi:hypothetical protein
VSARPFLVANAELPGRLTGSDRHHVALDLPPEIDPLPRLPEPATSDEAARRPRWSRRRLVAVTVAVVVVIAAVGLVVRSIVSPATAALPYDTGLLTCDGTRYPDAAPYGGPAPHPIVFLIDGGTEQAGNQWAQLYPANADTTAPTPDTDTTGPGPTAESAAPAIGSAWNPEDVQTVQLIAFVRRISLGSAEVAQCQYQRTYGGLGRPQIDVGPVEPIMMYVGTYQVDLFELRTHRHLFTTTITGTDTACPQTLPVTVFELATQPTEGQFEGELRGFVDGP